MHSAAIDSPAVALDDREDAEAIAAFRALVDSVVVHDRADGGVEAEVIGHLAALLGKDAENWGERVVAEEGLATTKP